ncbi:Ubiquitin and wlm domain-containing metalloprotease [Thalictrum thalictroides]|uniref:Ubiquitin and wlm domain-containing metalloprotease n=1 Tax=Thalictrum thalictroides TaxID=46969 RepID=A0A7J6UVA8_THATH|nr:Ubiquitin and wlm domain-containing metalloprotease [Thalictrum thalictroides]
MEEDEIVNISVIWRSNKFNVEISSYATLKEFGHKLQHLTNVKPDTMRLLLPRSSNNSSKLLTPFSDDHSSLSLKDSSILEAGGKSLRMMGVFEDEIDVLSQNGTKEDLRIAGFDEEEKRLRQRMTTRPNTSLKLPQGPYIFCDFRTLHLPGIELNPPASEALKRMHMLAADPGIVALMNKYRWRVGVMTEMAPVGYVGISPKCLLGLNKNHGEEISLRLRTDDLKGFRKYESIKKTLLHELAHMVYSEHDAQFYALDSQLNREAASLDWTRSKGHTLSGLRRSDHYEEEFFEETGRISQKLGGKTTDEMATARATSVAAAHRRIVSSFNNSVKGQDVKVEPDPDDIDSEMHVEPDPDDSTMKVERQQEDEKNPHCEPDPDDEFVLEDSTVGKTISNYRLAEPDPDDSLKTENTNDRNHPSVVSQELHANDAVMKGPMSEIWKFGELDPDVLNLVCGELDPNRIQSEPYSDESNLGKATWECGRSVEPDLDDSLINRHMQHEDSCLLESGEDVSHINKMQKEPEPDDSSVEKAAGQCGSNVGHVPHAFTRNGVLQHEPDPDAKIEDIMDTSNSSYDLTNSNDQELQRIQDPVSVICTRLQKAIEMLKSEVNPAEATLVLQTLFKIIRNVIQHPDEIKFKRLRKDNPQFQRNVAKYKAAMEVLFLNADSPIGIGYLTRNSAGTFLYAGTESGNAGSAEEGECRAILQAAKEANRQQLKNIELETDNQGAANYLTGKSANISWSSINILDETIMFCNNSFESCMFLFTPRSGNSAAHILAAVRDKSSPVPCFYSTPPPWLDIQLDSDLLLCNIVNF